MSQEKPKWQIMPDLTDEERASLKADIRANGILVPVEYDEHDDILDGHNRVQILLEIQEEYASKGWDVPAHLKHYDKHVRRGMTDEQKRDHIIALNLKRRHLSHEARREIFKTLRQEGKSLEQIALLGGVAPSTVQIALDSLPEDVVLPRFIQARDGTLRPAAYANRTLITSERSVREEAAAARKAARAAIPDWLPAMSDRFVTMEGDFSETAERLPAATAAAIITDPPYVGEALDVWAKLIQFAEHTLKPQGVLLALSHQYYMPRVLADLCTGTTVEYVWTLAYMMEGASRKVYDRGALNGWKPLFLFSKGKLNTEVFQYYDVIRSPAPSKEYHEWGQNLEAFKSIVDTFSFPGDVVIDPMMGGGTTGVACLHLNRIFLGIDKDPEAIKVSRQRLNDEQARLEEAKGD